MTGASLTGVTVMVSVLRGAVGGAVVDHDGEGAVEVGRVIAGVDVGDGVQHGLVVARRWPNRSGSACRWPRCMSR